MNRADFTDEEWLNLRRAVRLYLEEQGLLMAAYTLDGDALQAQEAVNF